MKKYKLYDIIGDVINIEHIYRYIVMLSVSLGRQLVCFFIIIINARPVKICPFPETAISPRKELSLAAMHAFFSRMTVM